MFTDLQSRKARLNKNRAIDDLKLFSVCVLYGIAIYLAMDLFSFIVWVLSEQVPAEGFYLGKVTADILSILTK
jgi:hypothetical protein